MIVALLAAAAAGSCGNRSYWVQPAEDQLGLLLEFPIVTAYCVPTAAGNLLTYLMAAERPDPLFSPYPNNNDLDHYLPASSGYFLTGIHDANYEYGYEESYDEDDGVSGAKFWGVAPSDATELASLQRRSYLGDSIHPVDSRNLGLLMKTNNANGTRVDDARAGLQAYLDGNDVFGAPKKVVGVDRLGENDADFLAQQTPPYMLHISPDCIGNAMWQLDAANRTTAANIKATNVTEPILGSTLGHTIVVYEQNSTSAGVETVGAVGIAAVRVDGVRGCDDAQTNFFATEHCVVGVTRIDDNVTAGTTATTTVIATTTPSASSADWRKTPWAVAIWIALGVGALVLLMLAVRWWMVNCLQGDGNGVVGSLL